MPKVPMYTLAWSSARETYELYQTRDRGVLRIVIESRDWFAWLDQVSSFAFVGKSGRYTAHKEAKQRGDRYWSAYLATGEHLTKKYLGKTADLTMARLERIAEVLDADQIISWPTGQAGTSLLPPESSSQVPPPLSPRAASADNAVDAVPAQQRHPLRPLLAIKLRVPRPRAHLVPRSHLFERLQQGVERSLTLISAPAGFGKTTLLAQWFGESGMPVAWLSLEAEDNDPTRFLFYLIAALQTLDAQIGTTALAMLRTPRPPLPETVLAVLISELTSRGTGEFALVLDDYHVITADPNQRGMTFLLEHLPPQLHLILATRADPPLPLARLRAQGQLGEVRAADLRFDTEEVSTFLQTVMGLDLEAWAIRTLEQRTEGWVAGLQLAALSLQGRADISGFLAAFSGSHRYVLDYLSDEVLARQSALVQQFLLHTCILERLSGPLCDAVREQEESQAMLEALERANLFVVALDDERSWYRYHHLFAQALRSHLQQTEPTLIPELHRRASAWYERHKLLVEAVQHALAAPDVERAARLIEPIALLIVFQGQTSTVLGWLNALPDAQVRARPFLCVYYARLLIFTNQLQEAEARLQDAERGIQKEMPAEQARTIWGHVLTIRASIALFSGDILRAFSLAQRALELLPESEVILRAGALATTIRAYQVSGDVTQYHLDKANHCTDGHCSYWLRKPHCTQHVHWQCHTTRLLSELDFFLSKWYWDVTSDTEHAVAAAVAPIRASGNLISTVSSTCLLARLHTLQGKLRQAAATYAQVVQVIPRPEALQTIFSSLFYYFGLGDLLREWNDLDAAERHLAQGMVMVEETRPVEPPAAILGYTTLARLEQARGNTHAAIVALDTLAQVAEQRHFAPHTMAQVASVRAQLELAQGNLAAAIGWADTSGLSTEDDDLSYPREGEYLAMARVRIAQARDDPASSSLRDVLVLLDRLLQDAETKERKGSVLQILVLRALGLEAQGDRTGALSTLERSLKLAAPEGYIRLFVDEGPQMLTLLRLASRRGIIPGYIATLLSAFGEQHTSDPPIPATRPSGPTEPLTGRERDVLRLLLEGASNREIARRLVVSVNTVKRHVYNLCGKLGVQSRTQAIARARTLNLV